METLKDHPEIDNLIREHGAAALLDVAEKMPAIARAFLVIDSCRTMGQLAVADRFADLACRTDAGRCLTRPRCFLNIAAKRAMRRIVYDRARRAA